jgi:hypothetical protein
MVDHCLANGVATLTSVVRPGFRSQVLAMGWTAEALGPVRELGGMALGAFCIDLDAETPQAGVERYLHSGGRVELDRSRTRERAGRSALRLRFRRRCGRRSGGAGMSARHEPADLDRHAAELARTGYVVAPAAIGSFESHASRQEERP